MGTRFCREVKGRKSLGEVWINGKTTLEMRLKNKVSSGDGVDVYLFQNEVQWWGLKKRLMVLRHMNVEEFLDQLSEHQLFKKDSTPMCHLKFVSILFLLRDD